MSKLEHVHLHRDNVHEFASLYVAVFNAPPWNDGWSTTAVVERLQSFAGNPAFKGFGLKSQGEEVALVLGWRERWIHSWEFHVKEMCVHPDRQGQGIGTHLIQLLEEELYSEGVSAITLQTGSNTPAKAFYEGLNFKAIGLSSLSKKLA